MSKKTSAVWSKECDCGRNVKPCDVSRTEFLLNHKTGKWRKINLSKYSYFLREKLCCGIFSQVKRVKKATIQLFESKSFISPFFCVHFILHIFVFDFPLSSQYYRFPIVIVLLVFYQYYICTTHIVCDETLI